MRRGWATSWWGLPGRDVYAKAWLSPAGRAPDLDAEEPGVEVEAG
ncbi:hypothetical protein [Amycolatopsis echigonensis]|nr:hypothetical protein [Amycolatopsis niigatensis]